MGRPAGPGAPPPDPTPPPAPARPPAGSRPAALRSGYLAGLAAAVLFGASAPLAKRVGEGVDPQLLAGLLSAGAFVAVAPVAAARRRRVHDSPFTRRDTAPLLGVVLIGGVVAPVLLMGGLQRVSGISAALLLNLEGPLTVLLGVAVFHEHLGRRGAVSAALIFAGAVVLGLGGGDSGRGDPVGAALVVGACLGWALDNNLTQVLTARDPFAVVTVKTAAAATLNLGIGGLRGAAWPPAGTIVAVLVVGSLAYGVSVVAAAYSLRHLGAAREAAVFATAPVAGVAVAVVLLDERPTVGAGLALVLMATGLATLLGDHHAHRHAHRSLEHAHRHGHDEHHAHPHGPGDPPGEQHAHRHRHVAFEHTGEHASDAHHRHAHRPGPDGGDAAG